MACGNIDFEFTHSPNAPVISGVFLIEHQALKALLVFNGRDVLKLHVIWLYNL